MTELLFSYGTLQLKQVQKESFGRILNGTKEVLIGYRLEQVKITDVDVLKTSGKEFHPIAIQSQLDTDKIEGMLYQITKEELMQADKYEVEDYKRVKVTFESSKQGWIYVKR